jgi:hypothetical protein
MRLDAADRTPTTAEFGDGVATRSGSIPIEREDAAQKEFGGGI